MVRRQENQSGMLFGATIRRLRREQKLSQEQLAAKAGLHRTYIGGIERGERNPSLKNIVAIAAALGVSPAVLLEALGCDGRDGTK